MFILKDNFTGFDSNGQPYSFETERHTYVENLHSGVTDRRFILKSVGNRHILNTPPFVTGQFCTEFSITYLKEINPSFTLFFQYDKKSRQGKGISIYYDIKGEITLSLSECNGHRLEKAKTQTVSDFIIGDSEVCPLSLDIKSDGVTCKIKDKEFFFECTAKEGNLAIERGNFIGELILEYADFKSEDSFETENILAPTTASIPLTNGGDIPYEVTWKIDRINGEYFMVCTLAGGTQTRPLNRAARPGQYSVKNEFVTTPYIGIETPDCESIYTIVNGKVGFIDPNIYWECQKEFFGHMDLPTTKYFRLDSSIIKDGTLPEETKLIYGYEDFSSAGCSSQNGAREFRFDLNGNLTYEGDSLTRGETFKVYSPFDKFALSLIPEDCYNRKEVENHIKYNHYFECSENICFTLEMRTHTDTDFLDISAEIINIYETETLDRTKPEITVCNGSFNSITAKAEFGKLDTGVYKIVFNIFYGGKKYEEVKKVFEVFDKNSNDIPPVKSGLPYIFSMPNEIKCLERNAFDLWNPMPSCDSVHYIACATDYPQEAENRKTWTLTKPFKRDWYAWVAYRTCKDFSNPDAHIETLKNVDYVFYSTPTRGYTKNCQFTQYPIRSDHWTFLTTQSPFQQEMLKEFLSLNPEVEKVVAMDFENEEFTNAHYERLMANYRLDWMKFVNEKVLKMVEDQNKELEALNPGVKRSMYGPINIYVTPAISYRSLKYYGLPDDERLCTTVFNGFTVFEDYPHACAYQTYRGPFCASTVLLHCPDLKIYPEQYCGGGGGSIDGAVKFANAPMGKYTVEPYQNATHSFEYAFNTAYRLKDGYHYWTSYGFHRRSHGFNMLDELAKSWKYVIENKPKKPLKSMAIIADFDECDTSFDIVINDEGEKIYSFPNQSELAAGYIYECSREAGIPGGFVTKFDTLSSISADECDLMIVPTLKNADRKIVDEIRRLYNDGVNLIALSDVTGLEDIFGVTPSQKQEYTDTVTYNGKTENIYSTNARFNYASDGAKTLMYAGNCPAIFATDRTALINTEILSLGSENKEQRENRPMGFCVVGQLIKEAVSDILNTLSSPIAKGKNAGITLFEAEAGHKELMIINYVPFDNKDRTSEEVAVQFAMDNLTNVTSDKELFVGKKDGIVREIRLKMKPNETAFVKLICK